MSAILVGSCASLFSLLLTSASEPGPAQEPVQRAGRPAVVAHGGAERVAESLHRKGELRYDAGDFLVADLSAQSLGWLEGRGLEVVLLPALESTEALYVIAAPEPEGLEAAGGRLLYGDQVQLLVAAPPSSASLLHDAGHGRRFHCGIASVPRQPMAAPRPVKTPNLALGTSDPRIQAAVDAVQASNLQASVSSLASYPSRCSTTSNAIAARNWIVQQLQASGYTPSLQSFSGSYSENVIAELPGTTVPDEIIVIGAHYDSIASSCSNAPGADDNATGTAGVIEAARVLASAGPYERTIRFILFSAEENGLVGSNYSASQSAAGGENVVAMLNTDMSAYRASGDTRDVDFVTNNTTAALRNFCAQVGAQYVPGWASTSGSLSGGTSDHQSYFQAGFPAVFYFEDVGQYCPWIHTSGDSYPAATNDFLLSQMIVRGIVAAAATMAEPVDLQIAHSPLPDTQSGGPYTVVCQVTSLVGSTVSAVELHRRAAGGAWTTAPMSLQGSDWRAQIPGAGSPVVHQYWIRAFDDQGNVQVLPAGADQGGSPFSFFVGVLTTLYFDDFEGGTDNGWTHGQQATQDDWTRGLLYGKAGDPAAAFSGTRAWGNDLGASGWNGFYAANVNNWLRSPVLNLASASNVHLRYRRWLTVEDGLYDKAQIRVNGTIVWQNAAGSAGNDTNHHVDTSWVLHELDISALAAGNPSVQIEFRLITDGGLHFGGWNLDDVSLVKRDPVPCPAPTVYCSSSPNSVGAGALIGSNGETSVAANALELEASGAPALQPAFFLYGSAQASVPYGNGLRCVGGSVWRLPPAFTSGAGELRHALDLDHLPAGSSIAAGSVWNFQLWYRDPAGGGAGFNLSNALSVPFCP